MAWAKHIDFEERCERILNSSHVVYLNDMTIHLIHGIRTFQNEIYVECSDGTMFKDHDVYTLEEAADMERQFINICNYFNISSDEK